MEQYYEILTQNPLFAGLEQEGISRLLSVFDARVRKHRKGEIIIHAGTPFLRFGLVLSGQLQVFCNDLEGGEMMMATVPPGVTFGEALCYLEIPEPSVWVSAVEESKVLWLSAQNIRNAADADTVEGANRFLRLMATRMLAMNDRIQILSKLTLREKLLTFLSQLSKNGQRSFTVPYDRAGMAKYLGTDRSALSRELSKMKEEGILDFRKNDFRILLEP